jgi:hypothetical protein
MASADAKLISLENRPNWHGANTIRNRIAHNNGYGDQNETWRFSADLVITMEDETMMRGDHLTFQKLTAWLVVQYADWCDRFLGRVA